MTTHFHDDTIAAIATPPGAGVRHIVRISGKEARAVIERFFSPAAEPLPGAGMPRMWCDGRVRCDGGPIGRYAVSVRIYCMPAPRSYTREDVYEIHLPGAAALAEAILAQCLAAGARRADAGEFTLRAFLNGRIDLAQAESVGMLLAARTHAEERQAMRALDGGLSRRIAAWRRQLVDLAGLVEGMIDFEEDEFEPVPAAHIAGTIDTLRDELTAVCALAAILPSQTGCVPVLFTGLTNAGKSSLINALLGRSAAVVSPERSTTRDVLTFEYRLGAMAFILQDAPGYDADGHELAQAASGVAERAAAASTLTVLTVDGSAPWSQELADCLDRTSCDRVIPVLAKADCGPADSRVRAALGRFGSPIAVSAHSGAGLSELNAALLAMAQADAGALSETGLVSIRVREELSRAGAALARARAIVDAGLPELLAEDLRAAHAALALCVGEGYAEDVLAGIFSRFCIGK